MSIDKQLNVKLSKSNDTQLLEERRRYFKIKVSEKGRVLFVLRDDETIRFDEPEKIEVQDINIGGVFVTCEYLFQQEDVLCLEIDLFPDYKLNVMARVLRVQFDQVGDVIGYGCEFQAVTASQEDYIGKYIYMTQSAERQRSLNEEDDLDG